MRTDVHLKLDQALVTRALAAGPLDAVVDDALRHVLGAEEQARRRRWAEENALLVEALAGGAAETADPKSAEPKSAEHQRVAGHGA